MSRKIKNIILISLVIISIVMISLAVIHAKTNLLQDSKNIGGMQGGYCLI